MPTFQTLPFHFFVVTMELPYLWDRANRVNTTALRYARQYFAEYLKTFLHRP
jgi:hypothetical protein